MTDLRKIGYAGVELNLGGPHTHPTVEREHEAGCPGLQAWDIPEACNCGGVDLKFDCTPAQYHAGLDKLWDALGDATTDGETVFDKVAARIAAMERAIEYAVCELCNPPALSHLAIQQIRSNLIAALDKGTK